MQKQNGEIEGFAILVLIADTAINTPKMYDPPSPRKTFAFGKLYLRNIIIINIMQIIKKAKSKFELE